MYTEAMEGMARSETRTDGDRVIGSSASTAVTYIEGQVEAADRKGEKT